MSVHADISSSTGEINKTYMWFATDLWVEEISMHLLMFGFLVIGGQGCSQIFGRFVLVGRAGFALKISKFDKVT
jgi:hypothetical protein